MKRISIISNFTITVLAAAALAFCLNVSAQAQKQFPKSNNQPGANTFLDCTVVADNLVANCGFETGSFTPEWTFSGVDPIDNGVAGFAAHSGTFGMAMGSIGDFGCISQTLTTVPDQVYTLSYWLANVGSPNAFQVYWNDGILVDLVGMPDSAYAQFTVKGLVGTGADALTFCARNDPDFVRLDDIVVN